jgi:hypothetical protein
VQFDEPVVPFKVEWDSTDLHKFLEGESTPSVLDYSKYSGFIHDNAIKKQALLYIDPVSDVPVPPRQQ